MKKMPIANKAAENVLKAVTAIKGAKKAARNTNASAMPAEVGHEEESSNEEEEGKPAVKKAAEEVQEHAGKREGAAGDHFSARAKMHRRP